MATNSEFRAEVPRRPPADRVLNWAITAAGVGLLLVVLVLVL